ncbi:MAG: hypothetical protein HOI95_00800 [Chromatiales bacterium]|jgi:hypothetical protein|nr:hypothetical protein [Chromatiales bacterium]
MHRQPDIAGSQLGGEWRAGVRAVVRVGLSVQAMGLGLGVNGNDAHVPGALGVATHANRQHALPLAILSI